MCPKAGTFRDDKRWGIVCCLPYPLSYMHFLFTIHYPPSSLLLSTIHFPLSTVSSLLDSSFSSAKLRQYVLSPPHGGHNRRCPWKTPSRKRSFTRSARRQFEWQRMRNALFPLRNLETASFRSKSPVRLAQQKSSFPSERLRAVAMIAKRSCTTWVDHPLPYRNISFLIRAGNLPRKSCGHTAAFCLVLTISLLPGTPEKEWKDSHMNPQAQKPTARSPNTSEPPSLTHKACKQAAHVLFGFSLDHIVVKQIHATLHEIHHAGCVYHATIHHTGFEFCIIFTSYPSHAKHFIARIRTQSA